MAALDFEAIFAASFAIFAAIPGINTSSRRLVTWDKVSAEDQPALFSGSCALRRSGIMSA